VTELGLAGLVWLIALAASLIAARPRGDPLPLLAAAAATPFLLLHYPTYLAVGLAPLTLLLAQLMRARTPRIVTVRRPAVRVAVALVLAGGALGIAWWQVERLRLDRWRGTAEATLELVHHAPAQRRASVLATIEDGARSRVPRFPAAEPWLLRIAGRAALGRGAEVAAESAFRRALRLWPHEEAEFGLGLTLSDQGRRGEALLHLERVCRVNPALLKLVPDERLQRELREALELRWWKRGRDEAQEAEPVVAAGPHEPSERAEAPSEEPLGPSEEAPELSEEPPELSEKAEAPMSPEPLAKPDQLFDNGFESGDSALWEQEVERAPSPSGGRDAAARSW